MSGLSDLQRRILTAAASLEVATHADLLERVCGWKPSQYGGEAHRRHDGGLSGKWVKWIGSPPRAQRVALSRAVCRLVARGLLSSVHGFDVGGDGGWTRGHTLTTAGRATVDTWMNHPPDNRTRETVDEVPAGKSDSRGGATVDWAALDADIAALGDVLWKHASNFSRNAGCDDTRCGCGCAGKRRGDRATAERSARMAKAFTDVKADGYDRLERVRAVLAALRSAA